MSPFRYILNLIVMVMAAALLTSTALADTSMISDEHVVTREIHVDTGYQGFSINDSPNRAGEYRSFTSSPTFGLRFFNDDAGKNFNLDISFLSENDYHAELNYSHKGLARFDLRTEQFFHNLDHIPYNSRPDAEYTDDSTATKTRVDFNDNNPDDRYGIRLDVKEAKFRIKHPTYPAHINFAYWRYEKEGQKQLRFVNENCTSACHAQSKTRNVDRVTEEIKVGADAHIGWIDLAIETLHRTFKDKEAIERDTFGFHVRGRDLSENPMQHSEAPDSKLTEMTIKANTAPSGGLVGSASMTFGKRENRSKLSSISPVYAETDYFKSSADITYTPDSKWTYSLRYRLLDMESDNTNQFTDYDSTKASPLDVREAMDITRAWYEAIINYRPSTKLTLKGEFSREDVSRSDTGPEIGHSSGSDPITINPNWLLPDDETIVRAKLGFRSRHLEKSALKFSGWLALQHNNDPAYGTSYGDSRQLFFSTSYNPSPYWGLLANVKFVQEENKDHEIHDFDLDREKESQNASIGTYYSTEDGITFNLNYGYLHTAIEQDILFGIPGTVFPPGYDYGIPDYDVEYDQTVHTINAGVSWQLMEDLLCSVDAYHIRSKASFSPDFATVNGIPYDVFGSPGTASASSDGISENSKVDIQQNGIKGRINWQIDDSWSCAIETAYDKYNDQNSNIYDGTVASTMVSLSRVW